MSDKQIKKYVIQNKEITINADYLILGDFFKRFDKELKLYMNSMVKYLNKTLCGNIMADSSELLNRQKFVTDICWDILDDISNHVVSKADYEKIIEKNLEEIDWIFEEYLVRKLESSIDFEKRQFRMDNEYEADFEEKWDNFEEELRERMGRDYSYTIDNFADKLKNEYENCKWIIVQMMEDYKLISQGLGDAALTEEDRDAIYAFIYTEDSEKKKGLINEILEILQKNPLLPQCVCEIVKLFGDENNEIHKMTTDLGYIKTINETINDCMNEQFPELMQTKYKDEDELNNLMENVKEVSAFYGVVENNEYYIYLQHQMDRIIYRKQRVQKISDSTNIEDDIKSLVQDTKIYKNYEKRFAFDVDRSKLFYSLSEECRCLMYTGIFVNLKNHFIICDTYIAIFSSMPIFGGELIEIPISMIEGFETKGYNSNVYLSDGTKKSFTGFYIKYDSTQEDYDELIEDILKGLKKRIENNHSIFQPITEIQETKGLKKNNRRV